jgi:RNA ligase
MKFGELPESFLNDVPDEFYEWVKNTRDSIIKHRNFIESSHRAVYEIFEGIENQKEFALKILEFCKGNEYNSGIIFNMRNGGDYAEYLWKMVKPEYSKPFSDKG